jgi:hypothetical protein
LIWRVTEKIWQGQTAYIIGGGPSLLSQDKSLLAGKNIIVINSSYQAFPEAQFLVFADMRWWIDNMKALKDFKGKIIGLSNSCSGHANLLHMTRTNKLGLADDAGTLMVKNTTLTAAINLAVHLGVNKIVLLGIDQRNGPDGRTHHHAPHKWKQTANCYQRQQTDLPRIAEDLRARNIECVNASPGSALTLWPVVKLEDHCADIAAERHAAATAAVIIRQQAAHHRHAGLGR